MNEVFMTTICKQVDMIAVEEMTALWQEVNVPKIELLLGSIGNDMDDVVSVEMSEDNKTMSLFLYERDERIVEREYRGYTMHVGESVIIPEIDSEAMEILEVVHGDGEIVYGIKFMVVSCVIKKELGV